MDIERLRNDPAYWDEVAPEGATHYVPGANHAVWYRFHHGARAEYCAHRQVAWKTSINPPIPEVEMIPRPAVEIPSPSQPQWRGPEDGLPPVGTVCEARRHGGWVGCEIIAHVRSSENRVEAVFQAFDDWDWLPWPGNFRPLKSDKERAVEAAMALGPGSEWVTRRDGLLRDFSGRLYDAGLLKLPEDKP